LGTGGLFPRITLPGLEADHSSSSSTEVKNVRAIPSLPHTSSWRGAQEQLHIYLYTEFSSFQFLYWYLSNCRAQLPRGLRHELPSLARTLGPWVRIPLEAWMSVLCAFILCLFSPVCRQRSYDGLLPRPRCPTDCVKDLETENKAKFKQRAVEPRINR
jgi:hypothetical protein